MCIHRREEFLIVPHGARSCRSQNESRSGFDMVAVHGCTLVWVATIIQIEFDDQEVVESIQTHGGRISEGPDGNDEGDEASNERWKCPR